MDRDERVGVVHDAIIETGLLLLRWLSCSACRNTGIADFLDDWLAVRSFETRCKIWMIKVAKSVLKGLVSHKTNGDGFVGVLESGPTMVLEVAFQRLTDCNVRKFRHVEISDGVDEGLAVVPGAGIVDSDTN